MKNLCIKIKRIFRKASETIPFGYIILTAADGTIIPVNIRSILRYHGYHNEFSKQINSRLIYLNNYEINVRESQDEIDAMIINQITFKKL